MHITGINTSVVCNFHQKLSLFFTYTYQLHFDYACTEIVTLKYGHSVCESFILWLWNEDS
jgi:hypothetical protein